MVTVQPSAMREPRPTVWLLQPAILRCSTEHCDATLSSGLQRAVLRCNTLWCEHSIVLLRLLQDKLSYITDVAMREQRLPRKAGSGTLWDRC